jgi:hypothetical protein
MPKIQYAVLIKEVFGIKSQLVFKILEKILGSLPKKFPKYIKSVYSTSRCTSRTSLGLKYSQKTNWTMKQTCHPSLVFCEYFEPNNQTWRAFEVELEIKNQFIPYFPRLTSSEKNPPTFGQWRRLFIWTWSFASILSPENRHDTPLKSS